MAARYDASTRSTAHDVHHIILAQHGALRRMCASLAHHTSRYAQGDEAALPAICDEFVSFQRFFDEHLDYEERELVPILRAMPWGPGHVAHLRDEHRAQRATVGALAEDLATTAESPARVIDELAWFLRGIARDMDEEERRCFDVLFGAEVTPH